MKIPIPDDWNGEDWSCVKIEWPNSPCWIALLVGFLSTPGLGRYWDERTGVITDVQVTGREIWDRNWPFNSCDGVSPEEPAPEIIHCIISGIETGLDEETAMTLCGYNPKAFRTQNGILQVRDFCGDWVDIGEMASPNEEPPPDIWENEDPPPTFFACGKVEFIIDQFVLLSDAAWDNYQNPFVIEGAMRNAVTDAVNLERVHVYEWMALLRAVALVAQKSDFNDETAVQNAKCAAVGSIPATGTGEDGEVDAVVAALAAAFNNEIGEISEIPWAAYWGFVRDTFGRKDTRLLMSMGAIDSTADCDCAEGPPAASSIFFTGVYDDWVPGPGTVLGFVEVHDGGRRARVQLQCSAGDNREGQHLDLTVAGAEPGDTITIRQYPDDSPMLSESWRAGSEDAPPSDYFAFTGEGWGGGQSQERTEGEGYRDVFMEPTNPANTLSQVAIGAMRFYPQTGGGDRWWNFWMEIIAVNEIPLTPIGP